LKPRTANFIKKLREERETTCNCCACADSAGLLDLRTREYSWAEDRRENRREQREVCKRKELV